MFLSSRIGTTSVEDRVCISAIARRIGNLADTGVKKQKYKREGKHFERLLCS